jgi:hypothetical protein
MTIGLFEVYETKGVGICNAIFLLFTDLVILSLPDAPYMLELGSQKIYEPDFQVKALLAARFLLCF